MIRIRRQMQRRIRTWWPNAAAPGRRPRGPRSPPTTPSDRPDARAGDTASTADGTNGPRSPVRGRPRAGRRASGRGQPAVQGRRAVADLVDLDVLVARGGPGSGRPGRSSAPGCPSPRTGPRPSSPASPTGAAPTAARNSCAGAAVSPGSAPGAESVTAISKPSNTSRRCASRLLGRPVRREPVVDLDLARGPGPRCRPPRR